MLYTGKGDGGTTKIFGCDQRFMKSSAVAEALGTVDELNSFLGICKIHAQNAGLFAGERPAAQLIENVQQDLFIVQAELAGAEKRMTREKIVVMETVIGDIEALLPPIRSFFVSGGTELAALFDTARTIARRAERRIVALYLERDENATPYGEGAAKPDRETHEQALAYANRLSSLLYALARLANRAAGATEAVPRY